MDTLCGSYYNGAPPLPSQYSANIIAAIIYGEETYRYGQSYVSLAIPEAILSGDS